MPSYEYLIRDLGQEIRDDFVKVKLPNIIREGEDIVWGEIAPLWADSEESITIPADSENVNIDISRWLRVKKVVRAEDGEVVQRTSVYKIKTLNSVYDYKEIKMFAITGRRDNAQLWVHGVPDEDTILLVSVRVRDDYLEEGDTESDKFLLGDGYGALKYGVLALRVFDPERWPAWKQQYERELNALRQRLMGEKVSYKGDDGRRFF